MEYKKDDILEIELFNYHYIVKVTSWRKNSNTFSAKVLNVFKWDIKSKPFKLGKVERGFWKSGFKLSNYYDTDKVIEQIFEKLDNIMYEKDTNTCTSITNTNFMHNMEDI